TDRVNDLAKTAPSLPDQDGALCIPHDLNLHPEGLPRPVLACWAEQQTRPVDWVHSSAETRERRARVELYMDGKKSASVREWLEALMDEEDLVGGSVAALRVASFLVRLEPRFLDDARAGRILLDEGGKPCAADEGIFRSAPLPIEIDARFVHPEIDA